MILLPAIDILDGKTVRLAKGDFDTRTVYDDDPLEAAKRWAADGARAVHVVDLNGAKTGAPSNLAHVGRIVSELELPVQVGGGLRTTDAVKAAIESGAARVVLGTAAFTDIDFLDHSVAAYGNRVVVSVDTRDGMLATSGWTEQTEVPVAAVIERMTDRGVRRFVYSSIERDGMLAGPDLEGARRVAETVRGSFIYSGGVSSLEDLRDLAELRQVNMSGVIVGRALYEGRFTVSEGQRALEH